jgi:hypothetical protein
MQSPRPRGSRRLAWACLQLALVVMISGTGAAFLPSPHQVALAKNADVLGESIILAGPGGQYGILTVAPAGATVSVDGDPVDGYYPVTYNGVSGWAPEGLLAMKGDGGGGGNGNGGGGGGGGNRESGNGGVETVSADPVYSDSGVPVEAAPSEPAPEPVTGGTYGPGGAGYSEQQIIDIIHEAATNYGQSPDDMVRVVRCESGLNPHAVGGGGAYHGLFQFVPSTFAGTPYGSYDIYDPWANANAAAWMWSEGQKSSWVCQ